MCCCSWVLTWFTHQAKGENALKIWDFLIASKPSMIIFFCASIILKEWNYIGYDNSNMMECINRLKKLDFNLELTQYFKEAIKLEGEYRRD